MAEIPVKERSSSSWLWILLALLALALLAWWLLSDDDEEVVVDDPAVAAAPAVAGGALIAGEQINLEGVEVTELAGDMAFYIDHAGQRVPVFFDQVPTPGTATEGRYDINPGDRVNITGEVRAATDMLPENADPSILGTSQNYIFATDLQPVS